MQLAVFPATSPGAVPFPLYRPATPPAMPPPPPPPPFPPAPFPPAPVPGAPTSVLPALDPQPERVVSAVVLKQRPLLGQLLPVLLCDGPRHLCLPRLQRKGVHSQQREQRQVSSSSGESGDGGGDRCSSYQQHRWQLYEATQVLSVAAAAAAQESPAAAAAAAMASSDGCWQECAAFGVGTQRPWPGRCRGSSHSRGCDKPAAQGRTLPPAPAAPGSAPARPAAARCEGVGTTAVWRCTGEISKPSAMTHDFQALRPPAGGAASC